MKIAPIYCLAHLLSSVLFVLCAARLKINKVWLIVYACLFFIAPSAVFLIEGPLRYYGFYGVVFVGFLALARISDRVYIFLKTQEDIVRYLFIVSVVVLSAAVVCRSIFEINLRRDALIFWRYEGQRHPSAETMVHCADAYFNARNFTWAGQYYQKASQMNPRAIGAYEGSLRLAFMAKDWDLAIRLSKNMIAADPHYTLAYLHLGEVFRIIKDKDNLVAVYSRLMALFPDDENVDVAVIKGYARAIADSPSDNFYKEKREEVLADFEQLSKRKKYTSVDFYNLAFLYEQVGGNEEAIRFYTQAVRLDPHYQEALYNLGNLYKDAGNYKMAIEVYGRLTRAHPKYVLGYLQMGIVFNALGDRLRARQLYLKVIHLDLNNTDAYFNLGYLNEIEGDFNEAINLYEKAVELAPKNAEAYYNLGNVYARLGQNGEAIAAYLKTVSLNPRHQNAFVNLSILSFKSRDFQASMHYLEEAQTLGYNPPAEYLRTLQPYRK